MKVAIYLPWIYLHGGIERSILEIVRRSRHEWVIYTGFFHPDGTFPDFAGLEVKVLRPTNVNRSMRHVLGSAWQIARQRLPVDADVDVIAVSCDGVGDLINVRNRRLPAICLCFTPLRAAFDPVYEKQARKALHGGQSLAYTIFKTSFRLVDRLAWRHYSGVIAISGEVRDRIVAGGLARPDRISLAYPGVDRSPTLPSAESEPFILLAGRIMWTKNIELAIEAFFEADLPSPWRLVISGYLDGKSKAYLELLTRLARGDPRITFVLSPTDEEMHDLKARAAFCLFTPLNEDWGLVPLECMARGKPVIAVDSGGPRETIAHGETGYLLPPDAADWAQAIRRLANDPALVRQMGARAHAAVERFSWTRFVADVDDAIERYARAPRDREGPPGDDARTSAPHGRHVPHSLDPPALSVARLARALQLWSARKFSGFVSAAPFGRSH